MLGLIAFLTGLIVGSFLNVCIYRLPKEESVVWPASRCLSCQKPIAGYDNIPVVSFIFLRGRCRQCGVKISWQYPAVEFLTAALFVLFYRVFGLSWEGALYLFFSLGLLVQSFIDFRHQIIPDEITLPGILVGFVASGFFPGLHGETFWARGLLQSLIGILAGGGSLYLVGTVAERILKKEAMGGGDVKLLAMIGAFLGWKAVFWTIFVSSLLGAGAGIYLRFKKGEERIPFGPYLAIAAFLYLFFGPRAIKCYQNFFG